MHFCPSPQHGSIHTDNLRKTQWVDLISWSIPKDHPKPDLICFKHVKYVKILSIILVHGVLAEIQNIRDTRHFVMSSRRSHTLTINLEVNIAVILG